MGKGNSGARADAMHVLFPPFIFLLLFFPPSPPPLPLFTVFHCIFPFVPCCLGLSAVQECRGWITSVRESPMLVGALVILPSGDAKMRGQAWGEGKEGKGEV